MSMPVDTISSRLQHLDAQNGSGLRELLDKSDDGLILSSQMRYWEYMHAHVEEYGETDGALRIKALQWFLEEHGMEEFEMYEQLRELSVEFAAAIWARFELRRGGRGGRAGERRRRDEGVGWIYVPQPPSGNFPGKSILNLPGPPHRLGGAPR